jgi:heme/copper-type cytochrome/quinol oxidase subunit 2
MAPEWLDFVVMAGVLVTLAVVMLVWVVYFRRRGRKHRRKHRHHHERGSTNPTLAQTGGLPPARSSEASQKPPAETP